MSTTSLKILNTRGASTDVEQYDDRQQMMTAALKICDSNSLRNQGAVNREPMLTHARFLREHAARAIASADAVEVYVAAREA